MNEIETAVTHSDEIDARRVSAADIAKECLDRLKDAGPYCCTFIESIPVHSKLDAEADLKLAFECWANTWVAPYLRRIISKAK